MDKVHLILEYLSRSLQSISAVSFEKSPLSSTSRTYSFASFMDLCLAFAMHGDLDDPMARKLVERVQAKMRTGILVSNLGRLDLPTDYGDLHLSAIHPPAIYAGNAEKALEVLTFGGRIYLTLTFDASAVGERTVRAVKDAALQLLAS